MRLVMLSLLALVLAACGSETPSAREPRAGRGHVPPRPSHCVSVAAREPLQQAVDAAPEGAALCLEPGRHRGPLVITNRVSIWGPRSAVIATSGAGTTVLVRARGTHLAGFTIDGSGVRYETQDAAVGVREADDVHIEGLRVVHAVFGILVDRSNRARIRGNEVLGDAESPRGLRGDGIRLWETRYSRVEHNTVRHSRDCVLWYSPHNHFIGNHVEDSRYGTHLMYSSDNVLEDNVYRSNTVGVFIMYSRRLRVRRNDLIDAHGASGIGLGLKESGDIVATDNRLVHDAIGVYIDTSPLEVADLDRFGRNLFTLCDQAIVFHGRADRNVFTDNALVSNREQIVVEGRGDALGARFRRNRFDDYIGYDFDGDGFGDVPYEERSLSNRLEGTYPNLSFFEGTPALGIVEAVGRIVPLLTPKKLAVDPRPRMTDGGPLREER